MNRMQRAALVAVWGCFLAYPGWRMRHDHGDAPVQLPDMGDQPKRLADGSVFLPKPTQRQLVIRTQVTAVGVPQSIELSGQVVLDPQRGGGQAQLAGRLRPGRKVCRRWGAG